MDIIDLRLAKLSHNRDRDSFEQLVILYKDSLFNLGYRMLNNRLDAEDIVQETFLRAYKHYDRFDGVHKFSTWIYQIGINLCIDWLRRRKLRYSLDARTYDGDGVELYDRTPGQNPDPEREALLKETHELVYKAIDSLPHNYKSIVVLRYLHELSLNEISVIVAMPVTTIKTRIHRGREFLRKKLYKEYMF
ncbi:RNA polymerase sigma factor SigW [Paenibacillus psychroresistens]|uniref:RNA polymerase sigma factor n=1 Tax=Paenibacillus psychroresistens TaxID=1778678 RepID=A0A6B8RET0_9BACL|nr:RNA polymerase sigma factor SigW [Paenibacillus psychroresistens]QGQ94669.1 RNA polymerase sigma factor SigW [Paenibacillus psychroresistens]